MGNAILTGNAVPNPLTTAAGSGAVPNPLTSAIGAGGVPNPLTSAVGTVGGPNAVVSAVGTVAADQLAHTYPQGVAQAASELTGATMNAVQHAATDIAHLPAAAVANTARLPNEIASAANNIRQANPLPQPAPVGGALAGALGRTLPTGALGSGVQGPLQTITQGVTNTIAGVAAPAGAVPMDSGGPNFVPGLLRNSRPTDLNLPFMSIALGSAGAGGTAEAAQAALIAMAPAHAPSPARASLQLLRSGNNVIARAASRAEALEKGVVMPAMSAVSFTLTGLQTELPKLMCLVRRGP